jgi:CheY-like chemotaxis protein
VIDDETAVREITKAVLGRNAYQVLTAANGAEGVATFKRFKDLIHAVLVDHKMPIMGGPETVREIRKASADVIIVGMSGQAMDTTVSEFTSAGVNEFLPKPFTPAQLLQTLRRHLDARIS